MLAIDEHSSGGVEVAEPHLRDVEVSIHVI
jgi:hypothetical protein